MDNFKAEQFLRDIGLNLELEMLEKKTPLLAFISLKSGAMDSPLDAIEIHINNLIATYGEEVVRQIAAQVFLGIKHG